MDYATKNLSKYVTSKGIQISAISKATQIPYNALWMSLNPNGNRVLRADEFLNVCGFLEKNPMDFAITACREN